MENQNKIWRAFFVVGVAAIAIQQLFWADFRPVIMPPGYPAWLTHRVVWAWMFTVIITGMCIAIILGIRARTMSLLMGGIFLLLVILFQIPGQSAPKFVAAWTNAFKELTLSGGAFIAASSLPQESNTPAPINFLSRLIPLGKYFLAITMVVFGAMHFIYIDFVVPLVPKCIPGPYFWSYFAGVALIASGLGIILNILRRQAALWLGIMIFLWLMMLHIPLAIADPKSGDGNQWTSVFEALSFSGIALLLSDRKLSTPRSA